MTQIDSHIPVPKHDIRVKYPFLDLEIGQSFLAPADKLVSVRVRATNHKNATGRKFKTMKTAEGIRVWRVA